MPNRKEDYLADAIVKDFSAFIARNLVGDSPPLEHGFRVRDRALSSGTRDRIKGEWLQVDSLQDAFNSYWWSGKGFAENNDCLSELRKAIAEAIEAEGSPVANEMSLNALDRVLEWGAGGKGQGLYRHNIRWATERGDAIAEILREGRLALDADRCDHTAFGRSCGTGPRMNAGFTKYFALAADDLIIYDGRVGAAMGMLVGRFCKNAAIDRVPDRLHFRWGAQKASAKGQPLNRDPSRECLHFKQLPTSGGALWAQQMLWASWIIDDALSRASAEWCSGGDAIRKVEAALFVIGYSMPRPPDSE